MTNIFQIASNNPAKSIRGRANKTRCRHLLSQFEPLEQRQLLTADLSGTFAAVPEFIQGKSQNVALTVLNSGTTSAKGSVTINEYAVPLGQDFSATADKKITSLTKSMNLAAGATKTLNLSTKLGSSFAPGTYRLVAVIDAKNRIAETDETNNIAQSNSFNFVKPVLNPLIPTITLNAVPTLNAGQISAGMATVVVTNPLDSTIPTAAHQTLRVNVIATPVGAAGTSQNVTLSSVPINVSGLAPGASTTVAVPLTFPASMSAGTFNIVLQPSNSSLVVSNPSNPAFVAGTVNVLPSTTPVTIPVVAGGTTPVDIITPITLGSPTTTINPTPIPDTSFLEPLPVNATLDSTSAIGMSSLFPTNLSLFPTLADQISIGTPTSTSIGTLNPILTNF